MTLARAQKSPRTDLSRTKLPGSQTRCVVTRAPWELILCVAAGSALQLRLRLVSSTGSAKIVRASLRTPPLVEAVTSSGGDTWYPPHPHYRLENYSVNPVFTLNCLQRFIPGHRGIHRTSEKLLLWMPAMPPSEVIPMTKSTWGTCGAMYQRYWL